MPNPNYSLRLIFSFLAGILFAIACPKFNLPFSAWLAPGIVLWLARNRSGKSVFLSGFFSGLGFWLVLYCWLLLIPFHVYGLVALLGQGCVGALYLALWCWLCWRLWPARKLGDINLPAQWRTLTLMQRLTWPLLCGAAW